MVVPIDLRSVIGAQRCITNTRIHKRFPCAGWHYPRPSQRRLSEPGSCVRHPHEGSRKARNRRLGYVTVQQLGARAAGLTQSDRRVNCALGAERAAIKAEVRDKYECLWVLEMHHRAGSVMHLTQRRA